MNAESLIKILYIQALEQTDPQAQFIPTPVRHHATEQARRRPLPNHASTSEGAIHFLNTRAETLWNFLSSSFPIVTESFRGIPTNIPAVFIILPSLVTGLLINGLGTSQRVNLLNFPLLFLLCWNLGVYALTLVLPVLQLDRKGPLLRIISTIATKVGNLWGTRMWHRVALPGSRGREWIRHSTERFVTLWWGQGQPVILGRTRYLLHLGAAWLAAGIIISMYFRGLVLDYRATWESTFLAPAQVHAALHMLLGPAAWMLALPFPSIADIVQLQAPGYGSAAAWIHMWALTGFMGIVLPRLCLAWLSARSARQAVEAFTLPLDDPYYLQLLASERGYGIHLDIVPYSYKPSAATVDVLASYLLDLAGNQATVTWHDPVPYGQEHFPWLPSTSSSQTIILVCNVAQTPEAEVHGEMFRMLQLHAASVSGHHLLLVLDTEPFRRLMEWPHRPERQHSWQRLAEDHQLHMVLFDAKETPRDRFLQEANAVLWPPATNTL